MKTNFFACIIVIVLAAMARAQDEDISSVIVNVFYPCADDYGITREQLTQIYNGDLSNTHEFHELFGCFFDCVAKKIGMLSEDNHLDVENFETKVSQLFHRDHSERVIRRCADRAREEECAATGRVFACIISEAFIIALS